MKTRRASQLLFVLLTVLLACNSDSTDSDFDKFTGRWSLHVVERKRDSVSEWKPRQDHYKNRQGYIIYDGYGGMGVHHVTEGYEEYTIEGRGGIDSLTKNDLRHLSNNFVYFGRYEVKDSIHIIEHHIESANLPQMWGAIAKRRYVFSGDTLTLNPVRNGYPKTRLKWLRCNDDIR